MVTRSLSTFLAIGGGACESHRPTLETLLTENWYTHLVETESQEDMLHSPGRIERYTPADSWIGCYVEPHPLHLIELIKQLRDRHQSDKYSVYQCCIRSGPLFQMFETLGIDERNSGSGLHLNLTPQFYVPVFTLQEFLSETGVKPDYIRMNIEGSEQALIENYDFRHKPDTWVIETHTNIAVPTSPVEIGEILRQNGYFTKFEPPDCKDVHTLVIAFLKTGGGVSQSNHRIPIVRKNRARRKHV